MTEAAGQPDEAEDPAVAFARATLVNGCSKHQVYIPAGEVGDGPALVIAARISEGLYRELVSGEMEVKFHLQNPRTVSSDLP